MKSGANEFVPREYGRTYPQVVRCLWSWFGVVLVTEGARIWHERGRDVSGSFFENVAGSGSKELSEPAF